MKSLLNKKTITILIVLLGGISAGAMAGAFFALTRDLPQIRNLDTFRPHANPRLFGRQRAFGRTFP